MITGTLARGCRFLFTIRIMHDPRLETPDLLGAVAAPSKGNEAVKICTTNRIWLATLAAAGLLAVCRHTSAAPAQPVGASMFLDGGRLPIEEVQYANGHGTLTLSNGRIYVGQVRDGKPNGQGVMTYPDGQKYVGEFLDGLRHGQAIVTFADGRKFVGEYRDDKRNGQGILSSLNGEKYVGEYRDGEKNGQGTAYLANGDIQSSGLWANGKFAGDPAAIPSPNAASGESKPELSATIARPLPSGVGPERVSYQQIPGGTVRVIQRQAPDHSGDYVDYELPVNGHTVKLLDNSFAWGGTPHLQLLVDNVYFGEIEDNLMSFQGVYKDDKQIDVILNDNTHGSSCPSQYRVIELFGLQPTITKLFGSCGEISKVTWLSDGLRIVTAPFGGAAEFAPTSRGVAELAVISDGHVKKCATRNGIKCISTGAIDDDSGPEAFLKRLYGIPTSGDDLLGRGEGFIFDPTLYILWQQAGLISRKLQEKGPTNEAYFGCPDGDILRLRYSIKAIDSANVVANGVVICGNQREPVIIELIKVAGQWRVKEYTWIVTDYSPEANGSYNLRKVLSDYVAANSDNRPDVTRPGKSLENP